jgi:hypothetical protein
MPYLSFNNEPIGPVISVGVSSPKSLLAPDASSPQIYWFRAIADTGCTNTSVSQNVINTLGLKSISKAQVTSTTQMINANVFLGDVFLKASIVSSGQIDWAFPNRFLLELIHQSPHFDVLLGMDMLEYGVFSMDGPGKAGTFSW